MVRLSRVIGTIKTDCSQQSTTDGDDDLFFQSLELSKVSRYGNLELKLLLGLVLEEVA